MSTGGVAGAGSVQGGWRWALYRSASAAKCGALGEWGDSSRPEPRCGAGAWRWGRGKSSVLPCIFWSARGGDGVRMDCRAGNSTEQAGIWGIAPKLVYGHCQPTDHVVIRVTLVTIVNKNMPPGNCRSPTEKKQNQKGVFQFSSAEKGLLTSVYRRPYVYVVGRKLPEYSSHSGLLIFG